MRDTCEAEPHEGVSVHAASRGDLLVLRSCSSVGRALD